MRVVDFDIETADAETLYTYGPGFCRLAGYSVNGGEVRLTTDMTELCEVLSGADRVRAHNAVGFDLAALEHWHGLDVCSLVEEGRVRDFLILARHNDPPLPGHLDDRRYGLDAILKRLGLAGKVEVDGHSALKKLALEHGGYDQISTDDPLYRRYLVGDVEALTRIAPYMRCDEYALREHRVMWRLGHISRQGFRVDVADAERRLAAQQERERELRARLVEVYGLPATGKKPQSSKAGEAALELAFASCGVDPPRTRRGALATNRDALDDLVSAHPDNKPLVELCGVLRALNGERPIVQLMLDRVGPDGRVHPSVDASQASGRVSVRRPGLTVMGKRDRANILERSLLLADPGHVLIAFDLSQVDARAIAAHCQDPSYISAFSPGKDYHSEMAVELFSDRSRRDDAKPVTHATTYGMGAKGLAASAGIADHEARALLSRLDIRFPGLARFKRRVRAEAEQTHLLTNAFGRPMRIEAGHEYTKAPAAIGQGTARDLMMEGILRLPKWLLPGLRAIVHDEIVLSVPESRAAEAEAAVMRALQFHFTVPGGEVAVPILADKSDRGRDWADCYRTEKGVWPEVARAHRDQPGCDDLACTWHIAAEMKETA